MPYLIHIDNDDEAPTEEIYDDVARSVKQALDRLHSSAEAGHIRDLAGLTVRVWTVAGPAKVYTAQPTIRFAGEGTDE